MCNYFYNKTDYYITNRISFIETVRIASRISTIKMKLIELGLHFHLNRVCVNNDWFADHTSSVQNVYEGNFESILFCEISSTFMGSILSTQHDE